jgi:hypothetical protein
VDSVIRWLSQLQPGSLAEWVAGIAITLALIFALLELALERRRALRQERRSQASKVSAWFEERATEGGYDQAYISNASEGVVYDVLVAVTNGHLKSNGSRNVEDFTSIVRQIPPGVYRLFVLEVGHGSRGSVRPPPMSSIRSR